MDEQYVMPDADVSGCGAPGTLTHSGYDIGYLRQQAMGFSIQYNTGRACSIGDIVGEAREIFDFLRGDAIALASPPIE